ncbi:MAG: glycerophosphodiester phosphodiesterase [Candidatus Dormibacteria bacterium]
MNRGSSRQAPLAVSAHRGGYVDDTVPMLDAYRSGINAGVDFVEMDIRRTRDGVLVLHHDECLPSGLPLDLGSYSEYTEEMGDQALGLEQLLELAKGNVGLHLDLKESGYELELMDRVLRDFEPREFVVTSVSEQSLKVIKERYPQVQVGLTLGGLLGARGIGRAIWSRLNEFFPQGRIRQFAPDFLAVNYHLAKLTVFRFARKHNIPVWVWTVDSDRAMQHFLEDPRVTTVVSNRAEVALRRRAAARKPPLSKAT